jgi:hypothetical protein
VVYRPVPRREIVDALVRLRELYRKITPANARELRAQERREAVIRDLISNLPRTNDHPTLKTLLDVADTCGLTLEGAHRLFGYDLSTIREYDLRLNGGRTHIFDAYSFQRDLLIDLPARLASDELFESDASLGELVEAWHSGIPIRTLEEPGWLNSKTYYVQIGTQDSLGSSIPAGSTVVVEPVTKEEEARPDPRAIYLLQFPYGYRCTHCVVTRGKLLPFNSGRTYSGREEYTYPGAVRIAGRARVFALSLPATEQVAHLLPARPGGADLTLPWENPTRDRLFANKLRRFRRSKAERQFTKDFLSEALNAKLSDRSERRYRRPTESEPHVSALIHLTVANAARYTDALRTGGSFTSDAGRFSLETLLRAESLEAARSLENARPPAPSDVWERLIQETGGWSPLLSMNFPRLELWKDRVLRLARGATVDGLEPAMRSGSWVLLDSVERSIVSPNDNRKTGWSQQLYALRRGIGTVCGYLDWNGSQYALFDSFKSDPTVTFSTEELQNLRRIVGVAVPV